MYGSHLTENVYKKGGIKLGLKNTSLLTDFRHHKFAFRYSWLQLMRPPTLTGTITPILAGTALALQKGQVRLDLFICLFISALLVQAATNMLNDYFDFRNGQDREKWVHSAEPAFVRPAYDTIPFVAGTMLVIAAILGLWLAFQSGFWVVIVGTLSIIGGYFYSAGPVPLSSIALGEVVAAIFLGVVVTILPYTVQGNSLDGSILAASLPFALLIASMVFSNNLRDLEKDRNYRHTLAMLFGRQKSVYVLVIILLLAYGTVIGSAILEILPWTSSIVLLSIPLAIRLIWSFRFNATRTEEMIAMKWAARHHWVFGMLFACGVFIAGV